MIASPTTQQAISMSAAFVAGVAGSAHCFAMCGGLAGAMGMHARNAGVGPHRAFANALATQLGRIASYGIVGAIVGAFGAMLDSAMSLVHAAQWLRIVAGVLLLAVAWRVAFGSNLFGWLERAGGRLWSRLFAKAAPLNAIHSRRGIGRSVLFGALWGWLPCGLVYSMAVFAAFAGSPTQGALVMLAFGAGTLPSMLSSTLLAAQLGRMLQATYARRLAGLVLAIFGVWTIVFAVAHGAHHYRSH